MDLNDFDVRCLHPSRGWLPSSCFSASPCSAACAGTGPGSSTPTSTTSPGPTPSAPSACSPTPGPPTSCSSRRGAPGWRGRGTWPSSGRCTPRWGSTWAACSTPTAGRSSSEWSDGSRGGKCQDLALRILCTCKCANAKIVNMKNPRNAPFDFAFHSDYTSINSSRDFHSLNRRTPIFQCMMDGYTDSLDTLWYSGQFRYAARKTMLAPDLAGAKVSQFNPVWLTLSVGQRAATNGKIVMYFCNVTCPCLCLCFPQKVSERIYTLTYSNHHLIFHLHGQCFVSVLEIATFFLQNIKIQWQINTSRYVITLYM